MTDSILDNVKKMLGLDKGYEAFDLDVITHINTALSDLSQLGIGPTGGFMIEDSGASWADYIDNNLLLNNVKSYIFLRVRMLFDPPTNPKLIDAYSEQIKQFEWRINVTREDSLPTA